MEAVVVKVRYGDTVRRFNAHANLFLRTTDLNLDRLRAKCLYFFNLSPDTDLTFIYSDEDGDVITLGDDSDLWDAFGQRLNPLRIIVLSKDCKSKGFTTSSQSDKRAANQLGIDPPTCISVSIENALKSAPDPLCNALSTLCNDVISKASSSAPGLSELAEYVSKIGLHSQSQESAVVNSHGNASGCGLDLNVTAGSEAIPVWTAKESPPIVIPKAIPAASIVDTSPGDNLKGYSGGDRGSGLRHYSPNSTVNLNLDVPSSDSCMPGSSLVNDPVSSERHISAIERNAPGLGDHNTSFHLVEKLKPSVSRIHDGAQVLHGEMNKQPHGMESLSSQAGSNPRTSCPILNAASGEKSSGTACGGLYPTMDPFKSNHGHQDYILQTFHRGIRCDGCGMLPIMGPRFKSKMKDDYDLCYGCFSEMSNEADYTRMDHATYTSPQLYYPHPRGQSPYSNVPQPLDMKPSKPKLDSCFVQDITILDGTVVAPDTPFTKIWRMRNNGTKMWPPGTQLVWIGGDILGGERLVNLEIPANGYPVNKELDIAVNFRAPSRPGQSISYWKMASPSGQKFGQRLWVLIQVLSGQSSLADGFTGLNLNLPPENDVQKGSGAVIDVNVEPMDGSPSFPLVSSVPVKPVKPLIDESLVDSGGPDFQNHKVSLVGGRETSLPSTGPSAEYVQYPIIDLSEPPPAFEIPAQPSVARNMIEQSLVKELEDMGFKQIDLNKEILRKNEYDLEQSVADLCGFTEWDPLLEELKEMGFNDTEFNKKLLAKNGGSITRVVLDLIGGKLAFE